MATAAAGASVLAAPALAAGSSGSGGATPGSQGVLIGDRLYSGVLITLENCLLPDDKLRFTPSMSSGLDSDTETGLRVVGCELIQAAGILLRLPQVAMATGQVLFQRFFYTKSFVKHSMEHVSMACVHLASKIEEAPRRIRDVINVFHRLRHLREKKKPVPLVLDQEYVNLKNQIIKAERRVLKELGFCVHVKHPHKIIVMYLQVLECERNQHLVQTAWNYMNDSLRTDVFVRFQPESIACACIYLAARTLEIPLPNRPHWFLLFGASEEEIQEICFKILQLYTRKKVDLTHLENEVEKRKHAIEEAKARARGLLPGSAPVPESAAGFSPASKLGSVESPKEGKGNKSSPLSVKNVKRKVEGSKKAKADSPVNGLPKGHESRSQSRSREQSYSRSPSRSASPKRRKSDSGSTSGGSKSQSRSRSRSDSPPRQVHRGVPYKGSEVRTSRKSKDCKYLTQKPHKSRSRSSSRSRSRSRERTDNSGKYKKKSHYYRDQRRERSRSYERTGHRYERDHIGGTAGLGSRVEAPDRDWGSELRSAVGFGAWLQGCGRIMCEGPSRISGPIPPDPTLCPDYYRRPASAQGRLEGNTLKLDLLTSGRDLDSCPPRGPRIRPGALEILERGQRGVGDVLLQLGGISLGSGVSPKRKDSKDHEKENLRRIREIQRRFQDQERSREQGQPKPLKALWRSPKYDNVESRVKARMKEPGPASVTEPAHFLRAHSRCGPGLPPSRISSPQPALPGAKAKGPGLGVDFISHNARAAKRAPRRHSRSLQVLTQALEQQRQAQEHYNATQKGHVPHYLLERRDLWRREAEARQRSQPDPAVPPGHTLMPENQRLETLNSLLQSQSQLLRELVLLPAGADSLRAQGHRAELERKLVQIDEAIKIFSRPKVFVKMDS